VSGLIGTILPLVILILGAFGVYLAARILRLSNRVEALLTAAIIGAAFTTLVSLGNNLNGKLPIFGVFESGGIQYQVDVAGNFIVAISFFIGILITLYSGEYLSRDPRYLLYYPLIMLTLAGLLGIFYTTDLFNLFLLVELISVTASALIAFRYHRETSVKAGFKYLIMSSLGTMIMLFGIYFAFQGADTTDISEISMKVNTFSRIGAGCFLVGFSIKAGITPFHTWVPEVYSGAPSAISAFLAGVISKSMLFIMSIICINLGLETSELGFYLLILSFLNMFIGSIRALNQKNIRSFLSFSSIAQTGYLMFILGIGFYFEIERAFTAALFLFLVIAITKCLAFLSAGIYEFYFDTGHIDDLQGVYKIMPRTAYFFSLALAGLAGIPLLAGFTGKWLVFTAAISTGDPFAIIGVVIFLINTIIGLGGYLPMVVKQFQSPGNEFESSDYPQELPKLSIWMSLPVGILSILVVGIGLLPSPWLNIVNRVVEWIIWL
jgi:proton-translocating NADH-quinone oxidoreductase chain N